MSYRNTLYENFTDVSNILEVVEKNEELGLMKVKLVDREKYKEKAPFTFTGRWIHPPKYAICKIEDLEKETYVRNYTEFNMGEVSENLNLNDVDEVSKFLAQYVDLEYCSINGIELYYEDYIKEMFSKIPQEMFKNQGDKMVEAAREYVQNKLKTKLEWDEAYLKGDKGTVNEFAAKDIQEEMVRVNNAKQQFDVELDAAYDNYKKLVLGDRKTDSNVTADILNAMEELKSKSKPSKRKM